MIEHDWAVWSNIAQLAFGELTIHASPNVRAALTLQKLPAIDRRVFQDVFHTITRVAFKFVAVL